MFWMALVAALIFGWLRRGSLARLGELELRGLMLVVIAFALQFLLDILARARFYPVILWGGWVHVVSYFFLFYWLYLNRHLIGVRILGLGLFLNFLVILFNGGYMPVSGRFLPAHVKERLALYEDGTHRLLQVDDALPFLGDIFYIPGLNEVFSIGDVLLAVGLFWIIAEGMVGSGRKKSS
ncbi:hypothetical protein CTH_2133 [Carboxydocella thermautotrophica]|nr:hypothetical protein CTH_2133 [Carboxydocella thermautotrophica]GAW29310.1 hypothetical protein ULO1_18800 [Carboxydocella sp. ULO1]